MSFDEEALPSYEETIRAHASRQLNNGVMLASALFAADLRILCLFYPLLVLPTILGTIIRTDEPSVILTLSATERAIQIIFFLFIGIRWIRAFGERKKLFPLFGIFFTTAVCSLTWLIINFTAFATLLNLPETVSYLGIFLIALLYIAAQRYYFYFLPALFGARSIRTIIEEAKVLTKARIGVVVRLILAPFLLSTVYTGIFTGFSPDGRSYLVSIFLDIGSQIYWVLATYLALGVGFIYMVENSRHRSFFEPYIMARFDTMALKAPRWLSTIIHPRNCMQVLFLTTLIWLGNVIQLWSIAPAPIINVEKAVYNAEEKRATVFLKAVDTEYHMRGFKPIFFRIAGDTGEPLTGFPLRVETINDHRDISLMLPEGDSPVDMLIEFSVVDRSDDFTKLTDLYLWYGQTKIAPLTVQ